MEKQNIPVAPAPAVAVKQASNKQYVGEYLDSFSALNTVAIKQDAVFILIQLKDNEPVKNEVITAMEGVQRTLKTKNINTGLYTLRTSAPEYKAISQQAKPPAIVIACKGRGMLAVPGDANEEKLVQAFVAASQAGGGCRPSGCGPSSSGCK